MSALLVQRTDTHIRARFVGVRVEISTHAVAVRRGSRWKHIGSIQAILDNPEDYDLNDRVMRVLEALEGAL